MDISPLFCYSNVRKPLRSEAMNTAATPLTALLTFLATNIDDLLALTGLPGVGILLEKGKRWLVPVVFLGLGIWILLGI